MIKFMPNNVTIEEKTGENLLDLAARAGVNIDGNCGGKGTCGKCRVKISDGNSEGEYKLACLTEAKDGMVVEVPEAESTAQRKKKLVILPEGFKADKGEGIGVSVDIGTTSVVVMMWNLESGEMIDIDAFTNPQGTYGADVISRIQYTMENEEGLKVLHEGVIGAINKAVAGFVKNNGLSYDNINKFMVVGNTTMSHLYLGIDPRSLAVSPFSPKFTGPVVKKASELGLKGGNNCDAYLMPNIAGHVGSDITAGIITTDLMEKSKGHLFIDIGTNGEIVFSGNGRIATCSTAAGPAFEGSSIKQGMRAARGAIERVDLSEEGVLIRTIGDVKPIGICGSGIIDAVGEMVRVGLVDKSGKLLAPEKALKKGVPEKVVENVVEDDGGYSLILYKDEAGEDVKITHKDVREVQLAKAAIAAGMIALMNACEVKMEDLAKVSIAGAFGSFIRKESAINCGLIPKVDHEKIYSLGNSAGIGASMALLSKDAWEETIRIVDEIEHVELATRSDFQDLYMMAMRF